MKKKKPITDEELSRIYVEALMEELMKEVDQPILVECEEEEK